MKGIYGAFLGYLTKSTFGYVGMDTRVIVQGPSGTEERTLPRYRAFRDEATALARSGYTFGSIEGNSRILVTAIASRTDTCVEVLAPQIDLPILTSSTEARYGFIVDVVALHTLVKSLDTCGVPLEHIYDY